MSKVSAWEEKANHNNPRANTYIFCNVHILCFDIFGREKMFFLGKFCLGWFRGVKSS